jgi:t-SNARE complex subunit (syntaxin)
MSFNNQQSGTESLEDIQNDILELLEKINQNTSLIEKQNKTLGTHTDTHDFRTKLNGNIEKNTKFLIKVGKILSDLKHDGSEKQLFKKLKKQIAEATQKFQDESQKSQKLQRDNIAKAKKDSQVVQQEGQMEPSERDSLLKREKQKQLQASSLENEISHNAMLIREREKDVKEIESSIIDLGQVVRELNIMAHEQGEDLNLISDHIEKTGVDVESGRKELVHAESYDKCGKTLICWILVVVTCAVLGIAIGIVVLLKILNIF